MREIKFNFGAELPEEKRMIAARIKFEENLISNTCGHFENGEFHCVDWFDYSGGRFTAEEFKAKCVTWYYLPSLENA